MTKSELVVEISRITKEPRATVLKVLKAFAVITSKTVETGERVMLPGFGWFYPLESPSRQLFGRSKPSVPRRKIRFRQSRR